ncbi:hypothetical protein D3C81_2095520 [compost metagenome]
MPGLADEPLQVHRAIAECCLGFALGTGELFAQLLCVLRQTNATPTATGRSLDQQRKANGLSRLERRLDVEQLTGGTGHH